MSLPRTARVRRKEIHERAALLGWGMEMLAVKSGISLKTLRRIMGGKPAYWSTIERIATALSVPADRIWADGTTRPVGSGLFELRIRTLGLIETPKQLAEITNIAQEIVSKLSTSGVRITAHDVHLSTAEDTETEKHIVIAVEGINRQTASSMMRPANTPTWWILAIRSGTFGNFMLDLSNSKLHFRDFRGRYGEILLVGQAKAVPARILSAFRSLPHISPLPASTVPQQTSSPKTRNRH